MENLKTKKTNVSGKRYALTLAFMLLLFASGCCRNGQQLKIVNMRCEYLESPIGIDAQKPLFTWNYQAKGSNTDFTQFSYQINVSTTKESLESGLNGNVWSSDQIVSTNSSALYAGRAQLKSHTKYYWQVAVADKKSNVTAVSPISSFETAKMSGDVWVAKWITDKHDKEFGPAPMLRKSFTLAEGIREARLYISAAAYYKMSINGSEPTVNRLDPGYTHYDKRNLYATHDVTSLMKSGENVMAAVLGNGFYNAQAPVATWDFEKARWRDRPKMICELRVTYNDGRVDVISSDNTWRTAVGPYIYNNIYSGDTYDARLEMDGWNSTGFDDSTWGSAVISGAPSALLIAQVLPAIKPTREIKAVDMKAFGDTVFVYNMGINMSGVTQLVVEGERGTKVTLQHGELLRNDGRIEMRNLDIYYKPMEGLGFQTNVYMLKGGGPETFTPDFSYAGFQYVEVKADRPIKMTPQSVTAQFIHTAVEPVGKFQCSNELMNKIWTATNQSYLSNLHSIPTDCPQREKNGWTSDAHIAIDLGLLNFDGIKFYEKWMDDFIDNQKEDGSISGIIPSSGWGYDDWIGPVWDAALFIIPNTLDLYYDDPRTIEKMYSTCERYLTYLKNREDAEGCVTYGIGDWVPYKTITPTDYTTSCFYYLDNKLMARFAERTGRGGSAYADKAQQLKELINKKYFDTEHALYANGSQTALATALYMELVPAEFEKQVAHNLYKAVEATDFHLDFGVIGSKYVLRMLSKYGYADAAYRMASQEDTPSWGAWINSGLTTLGETWKLSPEFRDASVNHVFLGDVSAWMFNVLAGINYDQECRGFRNIIIKPHFVDGLDWVEAEYRSANGLVSSSWRRKGNKVTLRVTIPINTTATIYLQDREIKLGGDAPIHTETECILTPSDTRN